MNEFEKRLDEYVAAVNTALENYLPADGTKLTDSMRYSLMAGGKRIRPVLTLECCRACGGNIEAAMPFACALEMIHTYSLIYDDMPCMDNDDLRRGKPTNHVVFGEDMALMAGMGLYARAFELVIEAKERGLLSEASALKGIKVLLNASGANGIVRGQVLDMENIDSNPEVDLDFLGRIHKMKTSAMLEACAELGCIAANADVDQTEALLEYAKAIGLAFQIRDDILDVIGTSEEMGKTIGKDEKQSKKTFVDFMGIDVAQEKVKDLTLNAEKCIYGFPDKEFLVSLAEFLCGRKH